MSNMQEVMSLHETACELMGARKALLKLRELGVLIISYGGKITKDERVYTNALYNLLLQDNKALFDWLAGIGDIRYYDHERDKKGKLVRCKAKMV